MGEEKAVEKFDPATIMQSVKDKIKATFVSLIPDVQWEQMVKSEVDYLFKKKDGNYYRGVRPPTSNNDRNTN